MEVIYYIITSMLLATFFFHELRRFEGPKIPDKMLNDIALSNRPLTEREQMMTTYSIRRMLSGSWFRATWMSCLWLAIPVFFLSNEAVPDSAAFVFALPGGLALAISAYNVRKRIRGW